MCHCPLNQAHTFSSPLFTVNTTTSAIQLIPPQLPPLTIRCRSLRCRLHPAGPCYTGQCSRTFPKILAVADSEHCGPLLYTQVTSICWTIPTSKASAAVHTPAALVAPAMAHMAAAQRTPPLLLCPQHSSQHLHHQACPGLRTRCLHCLMAGSATPVTHLRHSPSIQGRTFHVSTYVCAHPTCAPTDPLAHAHSPEASPTVDSVQPCPFLDAAQASAQRHWPCAACSCMSGAGRTAARTPCLRSSTTPAAAGPSNFRVCRRPQRTSWDSPAYGTPSRVDTFACGHTEQHLVHWVQY